MPNRSWLSQQGASRGANPLRGFRDQMDTLFEDWFGRNMGGTLAPRADISETDREVAVTMELPGVKETDIDVSLVGDQLTVRGEKKSEHEDRQDDDGRILHRVERSYGAFQRTMTVPYRVDPDQISAHFKDGVLTIRLPKPPDAIGKEQAKRIPVTRAE
jgi:HSP20 family protein